MVADSCNASTREAEVRGSFQFKTSLGYKVAQGQPELPSKTLFKKTKNKTKNKT